MWAIPAAVKGIFAQIKDKFGRLDMLFNNAGMGTPAIPIEDLSFEQWQAIVGGQPHRRLSLHPGSGADDEGPGPRAAGASSTMARSAPTGRGRIRAPYTATKHAITGLTKSTILDGRPFDITAGQVDIGNAATEMTQRMTQGVLQPDGQLVVEPRMDVNHVAQAVAYMAGLPLESNVPFITVMATKMPLFGRGLGAARAGPVNEFFTHVRSDLSHAPFLLPEGRKKCAPAFWDKISALWALGSPPFRRRGWSWTSQRMIL